MGGCGVSLFDEQQSTSAHACAKHSAAVLLLTYVCIRGVPVSQPVGWTVEPASHGPRQHRVLSVTTIGAPRQPCASMQLAASSCDNGSSECFWPARRRYLETSLSVAVPMIAQEPAQNRPYPSWLSVFLITVLITVLITALAQAPVPRHKTQDPGVLPSYGVKNPGTVPNTSRKILGMQGQGWEPPNPGSRHPSHFGAQERA
jgi:hypothetical protein